MAKPARSKATRRDFLKLAAAGAAGVAAGPFISRNAQAQPKTITFARESSYVKNFDVHFQNVMAPALFSTMETSWGTALPPAAWIW